MRDELIARLEHYRSEVAGIDERLKALRAEFPQVDSLLDIHGVGLYTGNCGRTRRDRAIPLRTPGGRIRRAHVKSSAIRRSLLLREDHERRITVAAMRPRRGGYTCSAARRWPAQLLSADSQAIGSE